MNKQKALGRGLEALLGEMGDAYENEMPQNNSVIDIELKYIRPNPFQPRKHFDESSLLELGESIKNDGLLQPVVVTQDIDGFVLISGERRVRASKLMKLKSIRAVLINVDEAQMRQLSLIENIQRDELNSIELSEAYQELIKIHNITHDELSRMIHKSRTHITNTLRLLQLSNKTKKALIEKKITAGHARALVGLNDNEQQMMVNSIVGQKLSVRDVEKTIQSMKNDVVKATKTQDKQEKMQYDLGTVQSSLVKLGLHVKIQSNKLIIDFKSQKEIDLLDSKIVK